MNLSLKARFRLTGAVLLLGLITLTSLATLQMNAFGEQLEQLYSLRIQQIENLQSVASRLRSVQDKASSASITGRITAREILRESDRVIADIRAAMQAELSLKGGTQMPLKDVGLEAAATQWRQALESASAGVLDAQPGSQAAIQTGQRMLAAHLAHGDPVALVIDYIIKSRTSEAQQAIETLQADYKSRELRFVLLLATGAIIVLSTVFWIFYSIRRLIGGEPEDVMRATQAVVAGNLHHPIALAPQDRSSVLANIRVMVEALRTNQAKNEQRLWLDRGLMLVNETVRNEYTPEELAQALCERLADYLNVSACGIYEFTFVGQDDSMIQRQVLSLVGFHGQAEARPLDQLPLRSIVCEEFAQRGEMLRTQDFPADTLELLSQHVEGDGVHYLLAPLSFESRMRGALMVCSQYELPKSVEELLRPSAVAIGVAMEAAHNRMTLVATLMDSQRLTNQLQANQERLRESQTTLEEQIQYANDIVSSMQSGLIVTDHKGHVKDCNPALLKLTGLRRQQVVGRPASVLFDEQEGAVNSMLRSIRDRLVILKSIRPDAFESLFEDMPLGCIWVNERGEILKANARLTSLAGYPTGGLTEKPLSMLVPTATRGGHDDLITRFQREGEHQQRMGAGRSIGLMRRDGHELFIEVALINSVSDRETTTFAFIRTEQDLPWSIMANATLSDLIEDEDDSLIAMVKGKLGKGIPARITTAFLLSPEGEIQQSVININDVSALVRKSEEVREQNALLERTMDAMQDGVVQINSDGIVVSANPKALELLARKKESVEGYPLARLVEGGHVTASLENWIPSKATLAVQSLYNLDPDQFLTILEQIAEPIVIVSKDASITFANAIAEHILGYERGGLKTKALLRLIDDNSLWTISGPIERVFAGTLPDGIEVDQLTWRKRDQSNHTAPLTLVPLTSNETIMGVFCIGRAIHEIRAELMRRMQNLEWTLAQTDGPRIPVALSAAPLRSSDGRVTGGVVTIKDMQEFKSKEQENLQMVRKMEQSQRLDALGQLAAGVAHDFNNLLGVIQNHAELVEMKVGPDSKATKNLSAILQATGRARDIVIKLNGLGRENPQGAELVPHDQQAFELQPLVEETQGLLQASLKGIEIAVHAAPNAQRVSLKGDSGALQQVLVNLCVNASHAIGERRGGRIEVRTRKPSDQRVAIDVVDNGSGIPEDVMQRIFEPFFTTKEVGKGTGLGLAMVRSIVTKMGGTIDCKSTVGEGTTFTVELPTA
ncbi:MAG: Wide host range VirA protein [Pseudomonadota bacterium]